MSPADCHADQNQAESHQGQARSTEQVLALLLQLRQEFGIPKSFLRDALDPDERSRFVRVEDRLLFVIQVSHDLGSVSATPHNSHSNSYNNVREPNLEVSGTGCPLSPYSVNPDSRLLPLAVSCLRLLSVIPSADAYTLLHIALASTTAAMAHIR